MGERSKHQAERELRSLAVTPAAADARNAWLRAMDVVSGKVEATKDAVAIEMHQGRVEHFNALATVHAVLCSPGVSEGVAVAARVLEGVLQEQVAGVSAVVLAAAEDGVKGPEREIARKAARFAYLKVCENLHERFVSVVKSCLKKSWQQCSKQSALSSGSW